MLMSIAYQAFFRLHHVRHDKMKWESMVDPFLEWGPLHPLAIEKGISVPKAKKEKKKDKKAKGEVRNSPNFYHLFFCPDFFHFANLTMIIFYPSGIEF